MSVYNKWPKQKKNNWLDAIPAGVAGAGFLPDTAALAGAGKIANSAKTAKNVADVAGGGLMSALGGPVGIGLTALSMLPSLVGMFQGDEEPQMGGGVPYQNPYTQRQRESNRRPTRSAYDILSLMGRR